MDSIAKMVGEQLASIVREHAPFEIAAQIAAQIAYEALRAYSEMAGEPARASWWAAPEPERQCARELVAYLERHADATPQGVHEHWMKTAPSDHPALRPWGELSASTRAAIWVMCSAARAALRVAK
jgi:hypothetical protein